MKKKELIYSVVSGGLAVLSIWAVVSQTKNYSFDNLKKFIYEANPLCLSAAVVCMLCYIVFEGLAILSVIKSFGYKRDFGKGLIYSASDIYFSSITPSASGGQPASAFFMAADGIPPGVVTITLILNIVMYTSAILTLGIIALLVNPAMFFHFNGFSKFLILFGYFCLTTLAICFAILLKKPEAIRKICRKIILFLSRIHILHKPELYEERLSKLVDDYKKCSGMIDGHRDMLVKCFLCNLLQRFSQLLVPVFVYLSDKSWIKGSVNVWVTQVFVTIGSNCIPIPGAIGVSDYLLLDGLRDMMSIEDATNMELASRGIFFYCCLLLSVIIVGVGYFALRRRDKKNID